MHFIPLSQEKFALIDDEDLVLVSKYKWHYNSNGYAATNLPRVGGKRSGTLYLHRLIADTPKGMVTDHINRIKLDCRRSNLRVCDQRHNVWNTSSRISNDYNLVGVTWNKQRKDWAAAIYDGSKTVHLGRYYLQIEAILVYNEAARTLRGDFAGLNEIDEEKYPPALQKSILKGIQERRGLSRRNTSGVRGVSWDKSGRVWRAKAVIRGESYIFGAYKSKDDAVKAYEEGRSKVLRLNT